MSMRASIRGWRNTNDARRPPTAPGHRGCDCHQRSSLGHPGSEARPSEDLFIVDGWRNREQYGGKAIDDHHYSRAWSSVAGIALWYQVERSFHDLARFRILRNGVVAKDEFRDAVTSGWRSTSRPTYVLTFARSDDGSPTWHAWVLAGETAVPIYLDIFDAREDLLAPLDAGWPRGRLTDTHITVVGVGSIGSVACEALASYGIRRFALIDPDRLQAHNFARHRALRREHGRYKVNAVADLLRDRDAQLEVDRRPLNVAGEADRIRPLLRETDLVLGCPDGTLPRRTISHLAFWAKKPIVLGCVLERGAFGEVLRLVPGRTGCLLCNRASLQKAFDPEPGLDPGYDAGDPHLPMTAVTGDLSLIGQLAAKAAVATLMERKGMASQRLAGDHALIALRPVPDFPEPFNFTRAGELKWLSTAPPRSVCPSCGGGPWR